MKPELALLLWLGVVMLAFRYGGIAGATVAAFIAWYLSWQHRENAFGFDPFRVDVTFTTHFVRETNLATEAQRALLASGALRPPSSQSWPLGDGFSFTVLRVGLFSQRDNLIYWAGTQHFSTRLDAWFEFEELAQELAPDHPHRRLGVSTSTPTLELNQVREGIELWVTPSGGERLLAVVIPYVIFDSPRLGGSVSSNKRIANLQSRGWAENQRDEYSQGRGVFRHKYLQVTVRQI